MRCKYHFIIFFVTFSLLGCSQKNAEMKSNISTVNQPMFGAFLEQFETLYPNDTMMDLTIRLVETDPFYGHSKEIDSSILQYLVPIPPFFKASPSFKVKCEKGWYVFLVHQYEVANIELKYIDVISYDFNGNMVSRMNLPFIDAHGGLYYELDKKSLCRGEIAISRDFLEYKWYCFRDYDKSVDTLLSGFKILPNGSMVQVAFEKKRK